MSSDDETIFAGHDEAGDGAGELRPGTRVGDYAVERFLGAGAMGEVYLARQVILDQECALKIMPRELSQSPDFERRFGIEGRALAKLNHPSIVRVLYAGQADGQHYLTMEYVDGGSIEDMLAAKGGRLDEDTVRTILGDMLSALDYAHTKGIVHRDLKPANILMTSEGRCKISDFGLALVAGEQFMQSVVQRSIAASQLAGYSPRRYDADATRVETGSKGRSRSSDASSYVGTIDYMSPEVRAGGAADARSDIFAMGVLSYQMLTGRKPLGMARPPSSIVKTLSPAWDEWVARCMEFDASDRFQTAAEALAALPRPGAAAQAASPVTEAPVNSPTTGRLAVTSTPSGAKVSGEDGSIYGVTPLYIEGAEPGRYSFSLAKQGHESATVTGILAPGQTLALDADLKLAVPPAKPSKKGFKAVLAILLVLALAVVALIHYNSRSMTPEELYDLAWRQQNGGELNDSIANLYGLANWDEADPALRKTALNDWAWAVLARAGQSADQGRYQDVRSDCQAIIDEPVPADVAQQARDLLAHSTRPGGIVADSEPTASVQIDGFGDMKSTPALFTDVPPGEYNLVFLADGYKTESRQVVVQPGKETAVPTVMLVREIGRLSIESTPPESRGALRTAPTTPLPRPMALSRRTWWTCQAAFTR
jgi:serine/threonine protein kinase